MSVSNWAIHFKSRCSRWGDFLEHCVCCRVLLLGKHWQRLVLGERPAPFHLITHVKLNTHILSSAGFYLMLPFTLIKNILKSSKEEKLVFPTSTGGVFPFSLADCCQPKCSLCSPWEQSELIPEPGKLSDIRTTTNSVVRVFTSAACKWLLLLPGTTKIKT